MSWQFVRHACVRACIHASVNFVLVSAIETTFLNQSGPNLHEVFMGTRSQMSSIVSEISPVTPRVIGPERLKIAVFMSPHQSGGGQIVFGVGSHQRMPRHMHMRQRDTFLCARYLMNYWVDFNQICMDITLGQDEELTRFW